MGSDVILLKVLIKLVKA